MNLLLKEIRRNPMLWLLAFVPVVFAAAKVRAEAHTLLFVLSVLAIVPLAGLLSRAVLVVDAGGRVRHSQQVPEIAQEPDYAAALAALD